MKKNATPFQKGGGGTNYEHSVQAAFLTSLITRGPAPTNFSKRVVKLEFQPQDIQTDDLVVTVADEFGNDGKVYIQIKSSMSITVNELFKDVLTCFWNDYNAGYFNKDRDTFLIVKNNLTNGEVNDIKVLLSWAKAVSGYKDFITKVNTFSGKKNKLDVFRILLKDIKGNDVNDNELWSFLKCIDIISYDFNNDASTDKQNFIQHIQLAKDPKCEISSITIWINLLAYTSRMNQNGGVVDVQSIKDESFISWFSLDKISECYPIIMKLAESTNQYLSLIKDSIKGFKLDRTNEFEKISNSINDYKLTLVSGIPGIGKSAAVKQVVENYLPDANLFCFRADELNKPKLSEVFLLDGTNILFNDLISSIATRPNTIFFIDGFEKLLEGLYVSAASLLLEEVKKYENIKIVGTIRSFSMGQIRSKFNLHEYNANTVLINKLTDDELSQIQNKFPELGKIFKNSKVKELLRSPKYIEYTIRAYDRYNGDLSNITYHYFKDILWDTLIRNSDYTTDSMPDKRERAFLSISVKRAKNMSLFAEPEETNIDAINELLKDEILDAETKNGIRKGNYCPAHDILEDWALINHIESQYKASNNIKEFFDRIENNPAFRRALRLWVEDSLTQGDNKIERVLDQVFSSEGIDRFKGEEFIISIFKSDDCGFIFKKYRDQLVQDDYKLLMRYMHIVSTVCVDAIVEENDRSYIPIGSVWFYMIELLEQEHEALKIENGFTIPFLLNWNNKIDHGVEVSEIELQKVNNVVGFLIEKLKLNNSKETIINNSELKELMRLYFNTGDSCKEKIEELIDKAIVDLAERGNYYNKKWPKLVLDTVLAGDKSNRLCEYLPKVVIKVAKIEWLNSFSDIRKQIRSKSDYDFFGEREWGFVAKREFFPSGVFKTPVYQLLNNHPLIAVEFIVDIINYSVRHYNLVDKRNRLDFENVNIQVETDLTRTIWGSPEQWLAYRGLSVTHYLLESILMSLEKYLLELAALDDEDSRALIQQACKLILTKTNNVMPISVISSVLILNPVIVGNYALPILSTPVFYNWDLPRTIRESSTLAPYDNDIPKAQRERVRLNNLSHRKKYFRGLIDFVIDYQLNVKSLNLILSKIFSEMKTQTRTDTLRRKLLHEIDVTSWKMESVKEDNEMLIKIEPDYDDESRSIVIKGQAEIELQNKLSGYRKLVEKAYKKEYEIDLKNWSLVYDTYKQGINRLLDVPVMLANIGLRDIKSELSKKQKQWCYKMIEQSIDNLLKMEISYRLEDITYNLFEKEVILTSFHLLFDEERITSHAQNLKRLYTLFLLPVNDIKESTNRYFAGEFERKCSTEAQSLWVALINLSRLRVSIVRNTKQQFFNANQLNQKLWNYINNLDPGLSKEVEIDSINFEDFDVTILTRAMLITSHDKNRAFVDKYLDLLIEDSKLKEDYGFGSQPQSRKTNYQYNSSIAIYLANLFLYSSDDYSEQVLSKLISPLFGEHFNIHENKDTLDFIKNVFSFFIAVCGDGLDAESDNKARDYIRKTFWARWEYINRELLKNDCRLLQELMLLDDDTVRHFNHFSLMDGYKDTYLSIVKMYGDTSLLFFFNVYSSVGFSYLFPEGLSKIVEMLKATDPYTLIRCLVGINAEILIQKLISNHINEIRANKSLTNDLMYILDLMVELGSSSAYFERENVLTYREITVKLAK